MHFMTHLPQWAVFCLGMAAAFIPVWLLLRAVTGHRHRWEPATSQVRNANIFLPNASGSQTVVLWRCTRGGCGELYTTNLDGRWTWDEVRGQGGVPTVPNDLSEMRQ